MNQVTAGQGELPFRIEFQQAGSGQLRALVTGRNDDGLETVLAYWYAIADEARRIDASMLLVVDRLEGNPLSPADLRSLVQALPGQGFEKLRIAFVELDGEQIATVEAAEIHARELGFTIRVFGNEVDAAIWLRHGER